MKVKRLKLAESIRLTPQTEDRFFDFEAAKWRDFECYYKDGMAYIINKKTQEAELTSMANIRQMAVYKHDLHDLGNNSGNDQANKSSKRGIAKVSNILKAE